MTVLAWIVLGLIAGLVASNLATSTGRGLLLDLLLGVVGAVFGGLVSFALRAPEIGGLDFYSTLVASLGAAAVLWAYHSVVRLI
jgi:uncharacterized membrane protein YeaQ/YmgE (transglycosylase-associated protein family)